MREAEELADFQVELTSLSALQGAPVDLGEFGELVLREFGS